MTTKKAEQEHIEKLRREGRLIETFTHFKRLIEDDGKDEYPRLVDYDEPKEPTNGGS